MRKREIRERKRERERERERDREWLCAYTVCTDFIGDYVFFWTYPGWSLHGEKGLC